MKRLTWIAIAAGFSLAPWMAFAQTAAAQQAPATHTPVTAPQQQASQIPPDQQASREQLMKLFDVMRLRQQYAGIQTMLPKMIQQQMHAQMQETMAKLPASKQLTPAQESALESILNKYMQKALNVYPADEMMNDAAAVYQRHIARTDVDACIAFYNSPPGQHWLDAQPLILKEYMPMVMQRVQERTKQLEAEMEQELEQLVTPQTPGGAPVPASPSPKEK